jgi:hypothetical protein
VRLVAEIAAAFEAAKAASQAEVGKPARRVKGLCDQPNRKAWSRSRGVIGKADVHQGEESPRLVSPG